jgi:hypothetical protein
MSLSVFRRGWLIAFVSRQCEVPPASAEARVVTIETFFPQQLHVALVIRF